jgi:hypothetical protein
VNQNLDTDIVFFQLEEAEVVHNKFDRLLKLLTELDKRDDKGFKTLVLSIDAWDDRLEDLFVIPQVRRFMGKLIRKVPHLLFYMAPVNPMPYQILACLAEVEQINQGPVLIPEFSNDQVKSIVKLPTEWAHQIINGIKEHVAEIQFDDQEEELPIIFQLVNTLVEKTE